MLNSSVYYKDGVVLAQCYDPSMDDQDTTYVFMRFASFVGTQSITHEDALEIQRLSGTPIINLIGTLTPDSRPWTSTFPIYTHLCGGIDPAQDMRLNAKKRNDIRKATPLELMEVPPDNVDGFIDSKLDQIVDSWSNRHVSSYGERNGLMQLCLWRWQQAMNSLGRSRLFCAASVVAGFTRLDLGWIYQSFWQDLVETRPLATSALRSSLPLLPVGDLVYLSCPCVTGDPEDNHYEAYKRKFATEEVKSYSQFYAPFQAKPPFFDLNLFEPVL
jgi:hypothetical protein